MPDHRGNAFGGNMKHESIFDTIRRTLAVVRLRHQTQRVIEGMSWGLLCGSLLALPFLVAHMFGGFGGFRPLVLFALPAIIGTLLGAMGGLLLPLNSRESARRIDRHYRFKDRLLTALTFLQTAAPQSTPMERLQLEDARQHAEQVDPRAVQPYRLPQNVLWSLGVTLLALTFAMVSPLLNKHQAFAAAERLPEVTQTIDILRESLLEKMEELALDHPEEQEIKTLSEKLQELLAQLDESADDLKESLSTLSEMEAAVREAITAFQLDSVDASMRELAEAFSAAEATRPAGQAMREGQYAKAADELEKIEADAMTRQERQAVSQQLRQVADGMDRRNQKPLSQATRKMADAIEKNDLMQCNEGACELAGECRKQSLRKGICEGLEGKLALLGLCKSECNGGQCQGNKDGGSGTDKSNQSSNNWGTGAAGNPTAGEETNLDSTRERKEITGMIGSVGDSEYEQLDSSDTDAQQEQAQRGFRDTFQEYRKMSEAVLETEPIPLGQRQMIRRYFESIRPSESDTK